MYSLPKNVYRERIDFSKIKTTVPIPNLIEIQKKSYERFLQMNRLASERESWMLGVTARLQRLTRREREVFELVIRGRMNKQVAFELGTTERTVKAHRHKVMEKMQARSVVELVSCAERLGLSSGTF